MNQQNSCDRAVNQDESNISSTTDLPNSIQESLLLVLSRLSKLEEHDKIMTLQDFSSKFQLLLKTRNLHTEPLMVFRNV